MKQNQHSAIKLALSCLTAFLLWANPVQAGEVLLSGSFQGQSGHATSGQVEIQKTAQGYQVILGDDFAFDGAPDPKLAFGKDGIKRETIFAPLANNTGEQHYQLPASIDPTAFNEFYVWCEKYNVPLGVAELQ